MAPEFLFVLLIVGTIVGTYLYLVSRRSTSALLFFVGAVFLIGFALFLMFMRESRHRGIPAFGVLLIVVMFSVGVYLFSRGLRLLLSPPIAPRKAACPPVRALRDLLAERLRPQEHARLAAHLEDCPACQHRVEGLTAGRESWPGVARKLANKPHDAPALRQVIERLKGEKKPEPTRDEPVFCGDLPLGFLSPPDKSGQLGKLERYEVIEEVGRGGMGVVLKAFDPSLHRVVAIKVLAPQLATSGVARKRFLREAKAAAAVTHDHIVTIHSVDEANGLPYLVMQYVAGLSLQDRIDREGPIGDVAEVLRIGVQTAAGLAAAHAHGIVHRDIKPGNILLEEGVGRVKLTDFGLARAMDDASLTQSGLVAGSPLYMAPEQARGEALDHRADLFSLGSVLYTASTGRPPFRAANTLAVLRRVCEDTPRPIRETNPEVPDWFAAVLEKLMAKEPADRYQSASEVVEVLGRHLAQLQQGGWVPPPAPASPEPGLPTSVTFCPSCGASLHVPERMVGSVMHCAECGEPFRAEEGSEEIQVARAVPSPIGKRGPRRKLPRWAWALGGCAALALLVMMLFAASESHPPPAAKHAMWSKATEKGSTPAPPAEPFWKASLGRLPAEATLFGAVNLQAFEGLSLGDEWTRTFLRLMSPGVEKSLTPENLGRVKIDGVSMGYYEGTRPGSARGIVHLDGLALDGRRRIIDYLREATGGMMQAEGTEKVQTPGKAIRVSSPLFPFALGIVDDQQAFLARSLSDDGKDADHVKALEHVPWFTTSNAPRPAGSILSGYNPPWVKMALINVPPDACALALGEVPAAWRKWLTEALGLRACPRTFVFHLKREGDGVAVSLRLTMDRAGAELILQEDLTRWRREALDALKEKFPTLREQPEAMALLGQALKDLRWGAEPGSGHVLATLHLPGPTWSALGTLAKRASLR